MLKAFLWLATIAMSINLALGVNYTVGGQNGRWTQAGINYQTWASSITFLVGDNLIFQYSLNHNVNEVSKEDFDSCSASNPLQPRFTGGTTIITLTTQGSRYFICGTSNHCLLGMKVEIDTLATSESPPTLISSSPSSPPPPNTTPSRERGRLPLFGK
ncbi:hypothetical protein RD792_007450 [Penstemon davidsonii]|uniref:Phytocyanin domain-containing protein n=1 Tax=Penstemon davidsonii TaxID=160366 RepID=A0ABR0D6M7_9LAMI|nr:hypothetical protein RD792_007450 [Penstemon davidsonii]